LPLERHVQVDALRAPGSLVTPAGPEEHVDFSARVVLIRGEVDDLSKLRAEEFFRPMAFLAGLAGGTQVGNGRGDRARVTVLPHRKHLPRARELRFHEPTGARADMALGTGYPRMCGVLVRGGLGTHGGMAGLGAEIGRVRVVIPVIRAHAHHREQDERTQQDELRHAPLRGIIEIDMGEAKNQMLLGALAVHPPALDQDSERNDQHPEDQNAG
jgi:hypothetical protein